ncbi:hypothetical protein KIN20_005633 [Parelaphostrongylus tenuis]|uniref:Uncharacterized protein n=1 Tax=Parelaphostrongylus tenuis TaxID=148309 RepID=A0AAD5QFB3_PARTN|nr:hypothetical protein KIN20_005633 [Parelaphostrongylus tenuis]
MSVYLSLSCRQGQSILTRNQKPSSQRTTDLRASSLQQLVQSCSSRHCDVLTFRNANKICALLVRAEVKVRSYEQNFMNVTSHYKIT